MASAVAKNRVKIDKLLEKSKNIAHVSSRGTSINKGKWTDAMLATMVSTLHVPTFTPAQEPLIITRFFEFYLSGNVRHGDQVCATILDTIFLLRTTKGPVFKSNPRNINQWYVPNTSVEGWNKEYEGKRVEELELPVFSTTDDSEAYQSLLGKLEVTNTTTMIDFISEHLAAYEADPAKAALIRNLAVCLALITLRSVSKDSVSVRNAFAKKQLRANLNALIMYDPEYPLCPPMKSFVHKAISAFSNGSVATRNTFALLVSVFITEDRNSDEGVLIPALLGATVLTHTSRTGLGVIHLYTLAIEATGWSHDKLLEHSYFGATEVGWDRVVEFLNDNEGTDPDRRQASWPWSRIISDGHNRFLSPKENMGISVMFAACAEHLTGTGIWTAEWSKNIGTHYDTFKTLGFALRMASKVEVDQLTAEIQPEMAPYIQKAIRSMKKASRPVEEEQASDSSSEEEELSADDV